MKISSAKVKKDSHRGVESLRSPDDLVTPRPQNGSRVGRSGTWWYLFHIGGHHVKFRPVRVTRGSITGLVARPVVLEGTIPQKCWEQPKGEVA